MKKCRKVLSLVLALVMLLSAASVGFTAFAANKKDLYTTKAGLQGKMNAADKYELTDEQYATIMLDFADKTLAEAGIAKIVIPITDGFKITIDPTSTAGLNKSFKDLGEKIGSYSSFLGDIGDLDFSMFKDSTSRDYNETSSSDVSFIQAFVTFLSTKVNYEAIGKLVRKGLGTGDGQLNPGSIVNNFIPDDIKELTGDIVGFLKETLFNDKNASFDSNVATLVTDIVNGLQLEMLEGYTFEASDSIYSTIDKIVRVLTKWAVKNIQADTWHFKDMILSAMPDFEEQYPFVDLDAITTINWDWQADGMGTKFVAGNASTYIIYHLNNFLGTVVEKLIPEFKTFKCSIPGLSSTSGWAKDNSTNSLSTLNDNLARAAQYADIKLNNGGTFTADEIASFSKASAIKSYAMVLADALLKMFFPSLKVEKTDIQQGNICVLAVQALNEFFTYYIPEKTLTSTNGFTNLYSYDEHGTVLNRSYYTEARCKNIYKSMIALALQKFISGYLPKDKINFTSITNMEATTNLDNLLKDLAKYFLNYVCAAGSLSDGALGTVSASDTAYTAADRIIFSLNTSGAYVEGCSSSGGRNKTGILPQGLLPDAIKSSSHTQCTTKDVVDHLFKVVENLDFGSFFKLLIPNSSNTEMTTALLPNLGCFEVIRILNVFFPGTWTSKTSSLDSLITNNNLGNILQNILKNLNMNYHVFPALTLVATLMGLSTAQTRGEAEISLSKITYVGSQIFYTEISPRIDSSSTTIPSNTYYIKVENTSKGIPGGYHNAEYQERMWTPYILVVKSIVCENDSGVTVEGISSSGTTVDSNSSKGFALKGTAKSTEKTLSFLVTYAMYYENGSVIGIDQQARLYAYLGTDTYKSTTSSTVTSKVPATIYGSPSMFSNTVGYASTSNASATNSASCEDTVFPDALVKAGFNFSAADIGVPTSTTGDQYKPFSVSVPSSVNIENYYGTYTIQYKVKTRDTNVENSSYSANATNNINWVIFDDAGLPGLISRYESMALQAFDYDNTALWNAFQNQLMSASALVDKPSTKGTTPAALKAAFTAQAEALTEAYEALAESSTADYTADLKARLVEYADGDKEANTRAKFTRWDYTPVSYTRYSSSLSTVRDYYNKNELSSIKVTEALRFNEEMAKLLYTSTETEASKAKALVNLQGVREAYNDDSKYSVSNYTLNSLNDFKESLSEADSVIAGKSLDGVNPAKTSDYADARVEILSALNKLVAQPLDVTELYNLITSSEEEYNDNMYYTDEAWERFDKAIKEGYRVINEPQSIIEEAGDSIAAANALISSKYIQEINDAVANLIANPYVSRLQAKKDGIKTFSFGDKAIIGPQVIDEANYVIVPFYEQKVSKSALQALFSFSKNVSRYTYTERELDDGTIERTYNTYGGKDCEMVVYQDETCAKTVSTTTGRLSTGNAIKVTDTSTGNSIVYTVVVPGNVDGVKNSKANYTTTKNNSINKLKPYMINIINNKNVDSIEPAYVMACDLNMDGKVDVTDLVLLRMWENGTAPIDAA